MEQSENKPYTNKAVAFIDILGFRSLVVRLQSEPDLIDHLHSSIEIIRNAKFNRGLGRAEVSFFSDSIVISIEPHNVVLLIYKCMHLQAHLLSLGVLTRGGISQGRLFHRDDVIYGEGFLNAFDLESKSAVYPRVIVHNDLVRMIPEDLQCRLLRQDTDLLWHVDPLALGIDLPNNSDFLADGYDPHLISLERLLETISRELSRQQDPGVLAKWGWMKTYVVEAIEFQRSHGTSRFWKDIKF